jgi:hypothetical protein
LSLPNELIFQRALPGFLFYYDNRVRVSSTREITVIASNIDASGSGDRYLGESEA